MKTDWKDDIFTQRKIRLTENSDGTVTPVDATTYTQKGDSFGAKELNEIGEEINEVKKSVSDGKALVAAAITAKRVATAATATFKEMAENIKKIVLGSGNAQPAHVLAGKTFTNDDGVQYTGEMPNNPNGTTAASVALWNGDLYYRIPRGAYISLNADGYPEVKASQATIANAIGLNPDYMIDTYTLLGKKGKIPTIEGVNITPQTYKQTVNCAWKRLSGNVEIAAVPLPPANVIKKGYRYWIGGSYVDGTCEGYFPTPNDLYYMGNNPAGFSGGGSYVIYYLDHIEIKDVGEGKLVTGANEFNYTGHQYLKIDGEFCNGSSATRTIKFYYGGKTGWYLHYEHGFAGAACTGRTTISIPLPANIGAQRTQMLIGSSITGNIYRIWLE